MANLYKNERQMEFARLMGQVKEKGLNQSDVAKLLDLSRAGVSGYLKGTLSPSETVLALFRRIVAEQCGETPPEVPKPNKVRDQLEFLKQHDPSGYDAAREMISVLHQKAVKLKGHEDVKPATERSATPTEKTDSTANEGEGKQVRKVTSTLNQIPGLQSQSPPHVKPTPARGGVPAKDHGHRK